MTLRLDWSTLALQTVNFTILVWLLHRFLYRPVLRLLDARRAEVPIELRAEAWLARIEEHLAALPQSERDALSDQLADGARLRVLTATALPAETVEAWRARLNKTLGDRIAIGFDTDQHLVAGAELHFPNAVLRFSWRSALAAMRAELAVDGAAG